MSTIPEHLFVNQAHSSAALSQVVEAGVVSTTRSAVSKPRSMRSSGSSRSPAYQFVRDEEAEALIEALDL